MIAGDLDQAEALDRRALAIADAGAPEGRLTADLLNNLGLVYLERRNYVRAEELASACTARIATGSLPR